MSGNKKDKNFTRKNSWNVQNVCEIDLICDKTEAKCQFLNELHFLHRNGCTAYWGHLNKFAILDDMFHILFCDML